MTNITIKPLSPALGAEISNVDLHAPISPATLAEIKQAGVDTCYFEHSRAALQHSQEMGL